MNNLRISTRLALLIGAMSLLLVLIGGIGLYGLSHANGALRSVYEDRTVCIGQISDIQRLLLRNRLAVAATVVTPTPDVIQKSVTEIEANIAEIGRIWDAYMATTLTPEEARLARLQSGPHGVRAAGSQARAGGHARA